MPSSSYTVCACLELVEYDCLRPRQSAAPNISRRGSSQQAVAARSRGSCDSSTNAKAITDRDACHFGHYFFCGRMARDIATVRPYVDVQRSPRRREHCRTKCDHRHCIGLYNAASVRVACGAGSTLQESGIYWILIISAVILSTMHLQDLKDVAGDKLRNRQMVPLVWVDSVTRWFVAVPVLAWSVVYPLYLRLGLLAFIFPVTIGMYLAFRMFWMRSHLADHLSWQVWAMWLMSLYVLPLVKDHNVFLDTAFLQPERRGFKESYTNYWLSVSVST